MSDRAFYEAMSRDQLIARLKVAEDTLVLIGWSSARLGEIDCERARAAEQMWHQWCGMVGLAFCDPELHADLDARIPQLAATRDRIESETLAKIGRWLDEAVAGAGHVVDVPLSASEPTHDPKAGVRQ